jgi:hypothetical protein
MGSSGTRFHQNCNAMGDAANMSACGACTCAQNAIISVLIIRNCKAMGDAANISPRIPSTCEQNAILSLLIIRDCKAMGDTSNISPRDCSTCAQYAIPSLLIIHIIPSRQIYVAIDNPSFVLSVSFRTTSSYQWKDARAADNISHAENMQINGSRNLSHL